MKLWFDLCTPKETLFFNVFIKEFKTRGHEILITSRQYQETNDLIKYLGLDAHIVGKHGDTRENKLRCGLNRMDKLYKLILTEKPDILFSFTNPEACRIAYGLAIPIINFTDMPESEKVMRLTLPLSTAVFSPFVVKREGIWKYWDGTFYQYNCLDPVAWMPENPTPLDKLYPDGLKRPFIIYRSGEIQASYYDGQKDITYQIVKELKKQYPEATFFEVPRYSGHEMVDMQSLLAYADLFISGGATMAVEAAWWGTWTISCRPLIAAYDKWMEDKGLQYRPTGVENGVEMAKGFISSGVKNPMKEELRKQIFPLKNICDTIEKLMEPEKRLVSP